MDSAHYKKLETMYLGANVNTKIFDTTTCKIEADKAIIQLAVSEDYFHALGAIHGTVYFKMLDDAAYFAVSSVVKDCFMLTSSFNINILRPVSKGKLTAIGTIRYKSSNLFAIRKESVKPNTKWIQNITENSKQCIWAQTSTQKSLIQQLVKSKQRKQPSH